MVGVPLVGAAQWQLLIVEHAHERDVALVEGALAELTEDRDLSSVRYAIQDLVAKKPELAEEVRKRAKDATLLQMMNEVRR